MEVLKREKNKLVVLLHDVNAKLRNREDLVTSLNEHNEELIQENLNLIQQLKCYSISNKSFDPLGNITSQKQHQYEQLLKDLQILQMSILNQKDASMKQISIEQRNQKRREILHCMEEMIQDIHSQIDYRVQEWMNKKTHMLTPMKEQLEKDISMESVIQHIQGQSIASAQSDYEELSMALKVFERRLQENPEDNTLSCQVKCLKEELENLDSKINNQKELMDCVSTNPLFGFPELQQYFLNCLNIEEIKDWNTVYEMDKMDTKYLIATRVDNSNRVFVKRFDKLKEWKYFKNQAETLQKLKHQCIIPIHRILSDDQCYYMEMPFYSNGNLYNWLYQTSNYSLETRNQRTAFEVQRTLRFVLHAMKHLHENSIVHRDIQLENIMMQDDVIPVLVNMRQRCHATTATVSYIDPQVQWGINTLNSKSDIYSFGVTLYKCFSKYPMKAEVVLMPRKDVPDFQNCDFIVDDSDFIQLLKQCLHRSQDKRPTANEILSGPFFLKHLSNEKEEEKLQDSNNRINAFKKFISDKKSITHSSSIRVSLTEEHSLVDQVTKLVSAMDEMQLYEKWFVQFKYQVGIDAGALSTSLIRRYFEELTESHVLEKGTSCYHICKDVKDLHYDNKKELMIGLGIMLCKCLFEGKSIGPLPLSNILLKFLLGKTSPVTVSELEQFDRKLSNELNELHLLEDVSALCLDFDELIENGNQTEVTNQNLADYIELKCQYEMVDCRICNLLWIREGFFRMKDLNEHFHMLQLTDYHVLLTGEQHIDIPLIVEKCLLFLNAQNEPNTHYTSQEKWLKQILLAFNQDEMKQFLLFCTGYCSTQSKDKLFENGNLESGYTRDKITIRWISQWKTVKLPEAHVCFFLLDMPCYTSKKQMELKLKQAIGNTSDFYALA